MADYSCDIEYVCPSCREAVADTVLVSEPNWSEDRAEDRYINEDDEIACPECEAAFVVHIGNRDGEVDMVFAEHPGNLISCSMGGHRAPDRDEQDYWDEAAEIPAYSFKGSVNDALDLLHTHGTDWCTSTVNRMVFIHCFAALEAYLGDKLVNHIKSDADALLRIVTQDKDLKDRKLSLVSVLEDGDIVFKEVTSHLRGVLYHNLPKVQVLYRIAAKFNIFPNDGVRKSLFEALPLRHDCVHRNGRDKDGIERDRLTRKYVSDVAANMRGLVDHIEKQLPPEG